MLKHQYLQNKISHLLSVLLYFIRNGRYISLVAELAP